MADASTSLGTGPSTGLRTGIDIVHETAGLKPLRPADAELPRPPRRKAGKKPAEARESGPDEPPHSVDTYA